MDGTRQRAVRMSSSKSREPGFKSSCCRFEALAISFIPCCHSSLNCIKWRGLMFLREVEMAFK